MAATDERVFRVLVTADARDSRQYARHLDDSFTIVPLARAGAYLDSLESVDSVWFSQLALAHPDAPTATTAASSALQRSGKPDVALGRMYPPMTR